MFGWIKRLLYLATSGEPTPMCTRERLEQAVDDVNYWWAKLEEEGNPDRIAPWMLWGKHRQLVLAARRVGHEEVYHSPVVPTPAYARHFDARGDHQ